MISARDRILILAPHPDDESLGAGGLILRAVRASAVVRVIFATDGDDNAWAQRFVERRVKITQPDRARWGRRRREEALAAIVQLGLPKSSAEFLALPDQQLTSLLLRADESLVRSLAQRIARFAPTLLVVPSHADTHPDHSALFVLTQLALSRLDRPPRQLTYLVHFPRRHAEKTGLLLHLRGSDIALKRKAILCHKTQTTLGKKRFLSYAKRDELFYTASAWSADERSHPVCACSMENGALIFKVNLPRRSAGFPDATLLVALESLSEGSVRWALPLPASSSCVRIKNLVTGQLLRRATVRIAKGWARIALPVAASQPFGKLFVKLQRRTLFFDAAGWLEIPVQRAAAPLFGGPEKVEAGRRNDILRTWKSLQARPRAGAKHG
ncbi:MAG: N-acetylglucosamine malate deacetylase 1 [Chthoniobacter sp.]|jgi:LmbE family N-acetylglucosaminyl deacetylase|nr:N-acetylglucosamine malate deacetylase 1 [Chthoniobacter sp.]